MSIILGALALLSALICINPVFGEDKIIISGSIRISPQLFECAE